MLVAVRFKELCPPYNAMEVAGFDEDRAAYLVNKGVAVYVKRPVADGPPEDKATPKTIVRK